MKQKPLIFLFILILILSFILGVRYGQRIEKTNKAIDFVLSITPTKVPPTPTSISYKEYKSKKWGLNFTFPSNLEVKESTTTPEILFAPRPVVPSKAVN